MVNKTDINRQIGNFCSVPMWQSTMNQKEIEYMYSTCSTPLICCGRLRDLKVKKLCNNVFKVFTTEYRYG